MDTNFCVECLDEAFEYYGEPEYFNTDQGSQYTSTKFLDRFAGRSTKNSMDGRGRWVDNVYIERFWWTAKYEYTHLQGFETLPELQAGLEWFMHWYNNERIHSSLEHHVPSAVYSGAVELIHWDWLEVAAWVFLGIGNKALFIIIIGILDEVPKVDWRVKTSMTDNDHWGEASASLIRLFLGELLSSSAASASPDNTF